MRKKIIVIGGGIIGLCSAYYLQKEGHEVTIIDKSDKKEGASFVNAGFVSPSHFVPLAAPGVMKKGLKWMLDKQSPLYIKPRLNLDLIKWAWAFNKSCSRKNVEKAVPNIKHLTLLSQELYSEIKRVSGFDFHYDKKGLLTLCQTEKMLEEEIVLVEMAKSEGLDARAISNNELKKLEPNIRINAKGATYFKCDHHMTPNEFMKNMSSYLEKNGVRFLNNEKVEDLKGKNNSISKIRTNKQWHESDEFVLAAGSWSSLLGEKFGIKLLLQAGKGYCINTCRPTNITMPAILAEAKVAISPMNGFTRFAGTMEIAGINNRINKVRVTTIDQSVSKYYPEIKLTRQEKSAAASGLRPVSPDGLPYIGKSRKCSNLTIATGHAMMGWGMATATGKLISEIISNQKLSMSIQAFDPDRKF